MTDFCGNSIPDPSRKPGEETRCECPTRFSVLFRRRSDARILQKCGTPHHLPRILVEASQIPPLLRFGLEIGPDFCFIVGCVRCVHGDSGLLVGLRCEINSPPPPRLACFYFCRQTANIFSLTSIMNIKKMLYLCERNPAALPRCRHLENIANSPTSPVHKASQ